MIKVYNYSRHELTKDQKDLLELVMKSRGEYEITPPLNPTFQDGEHLKEEIDGKIVALVAPFNLFFDAMLAGLTATIISWHADLKARQKGYFATNKCTVYTIEDGELVVGIVYSLGHPPTEAMNFRTGERKPYKEVVDNDS